MKTTQKGPFLGINNRRAEFDLHLNQRQLQGDYLQHADNVTIDNAGVIRRRPASSLIQAMAGAHSLHTTSDTAGYLVRAGVIYAITLPTYSETIVKILTSDAPVSWVEFAGSLYYSNGVDSGRITSGAWFPIALPTPATPTTSAVAGSLPAGTYQVAVAYYNSTTKEEGGISASTNPSLTVTGGLRVNLPAAVTGATHINVYISTTNGSIPMLATSVAVGTTTVDLTSLATGRESNERYEAPLPAGTQLFVFNGCLCSVNGRDVFEGSPFRPGYYLPVEGRIPFPAAVSNAVPAQEGIYIVSDKTYWLKGPRMTTCDAVADVLPYGGAKGTAFMFPDKSKVGWFGDKGFVVANLQGEVSVDMSDTVTITPAVQGFSTVFSSQGHRRVVACGYSMNIETSAVTTVSDFAFTSISGLYGTKADGVYLVESSGPVFAHVGFGKHDFGTEAIKHMPNVYLGMTSDTDMSITVSTFQHTYTYPTRASSTDLKMQRADIGKGLHANWFGLDLYNVDGGEFTLATISFAPIATARRI